MKKILSLMCALWACVMMDFAMEVAVPATVLDLQNPTSIEAGWYGTIAYSLSTNALVVSGYESYKSVDKQTWITQESVGYTGIEWAGEAPFKGSAYYSNATAAQLNSSRHIAYLITGCDSIWCYGYNNSATCYLAMNIYELTDAPVAVIDDATAEKAYGLDNAAAGGKASGIMKQALDATKTYLVEAYGTGTSNSRVFEMAFFRHPGGASSDVKTLYCKMEHNWWTQDGAAIGAYAWGTEGSNAGWPGVRMTPVEGQANLWKTEIDAVKYPNITFTRMNPNDGDNQDWGAKTVDLTIPTDDKDLFTIASAEVWGDPGCQGEWSKYDPSSTPVDPGDKVAIRLVPGVWNVDGAKFACLTTNEGTAATVDIAWLAANAVISDWFTAGDTAIGYIPADTKVIAFGRINPAAPDLSITSIMANLWNHSDILDIDESLIYTITGWGGDYSPGYWGEGSVTPVEGFYITGSDNLVGADKAWHADAIKVEGDSYTFENLAAGDYKLKVTVDGTWSTVKGYDELTVKPTGVTPDDDRNICFTLAEAGNVTVAYTSEKFTVEGKFSTTPTPPTPVGNIRLVPGVWNLDGAKFAAITFTEMPADMNPEALANAVISDWFVGGDTVVGLIPDDAKVIGFGRFNPETTELTLLNVMAEGTMWNHSDIMYIDESRIYTITGWEDGKDYCPGYWGEGSVDPETKEISLVPGSWASDNAIFAAWAWPQGKEGTWSVFQGSGETLRANISAAADSILFVRFVEKVTTPEWDANLIAYKTADFKIEDCGLFYFDDQTWCAPATPDENDFYITGDEALVGQDKEWNPAAIPVKGTSYTFTNLPAGSYKLKVTVNGNWTTAKGYGDLTTVTENLSKDKADNICFTLGEAGDVVVTYTATVFTVEGKFVTPPEPQKVEIRLVPGVWNLDGAKFAAITFTEMPADMNPEALANAVISDWFVGGDTVVGLIPDDAKVIGFGRFNPETTELTLLNVMAEGTMWNHSDIMYIDESRIYTITGWEDGKDYCPGYWGNTPPQPAEDEWFLVGDMTDWQDGKITFANGPISVTLKDEGRTYGMKILKINGDKETWYSNKGIMERSNCSGWEFTVDVQDNSGLIVDQAGVYTFSMSVNEFGNPVVTVQYPVGEGLEDIDASVKAVKVVHGGQVLILRGEHIFTVMGQQVK